MARSISIVAVLLLSAGVASGHAPGEVVSYFYEGSSGVAFNAPPGGFVLTDVLLGNCNNGGYLYLYAGDDPPNGVRAKVHSITCPGKEWHFNSGLTFPEGPVSLEADSLQITMMGYIPSSTPTGNVPAVSTWGLTMLGLLVLTCGTVAILRRKAAVV